MNEVGTDSKGTKGLRRGETREMGMRPIICICEHLRTRVRGNTRESAKHEPCQLFGDKVNQILGNQNLRTGSFELGN
jgi:hypothetical protein